MSVKSLPEPTSDDCTAHTRFDTYLGAAYALWYPQMGGYVGKALAIPSIGDPTFPGDPCFDVYVWHDGEFPFSGVGGWRKDDIPIRIHHCSGHQFVKFGLELLDIAERDLEVGEGK